MHEKSLSLDFILDLTAWCHARDIYDKEEIRELLQIVAAHSKDEVPHLRRARQDDLPDYRALRMGKGVKAKAVADACGIKTSEYSLIENKKRNRINPRYREALDRYFNLH